MAAFSARAPEARRRISARSPSASADPRYESCTFADCPATDTSSFAVPNRRAKSGRVTLIPWIRSRRALRCDRNRMPLRTSTASCVIRNVCMRHDSQKPMTSATISSATPAIAHPTSPCVTMPPIGSFCQSPRHVSNSTSMSSPRSGAKSTRNMSTSRSRRFAMMKPRTASSTRPPRSSGLAGCRRCHSPSARFVTLGGLTGALTVPPCGSRRGRRARRAAGRPPPSGGRGPSRRWMPLRSRT